MTSAHTKDGCAKAEEEEEEEEEENFDTDFVLPFIFYSLSSIFPLFLL